MRELVSCVVDEIATLFSQRMLLCVFCDAYNELSEWYSMATTLQQQEEFLLITHQDMLRVELAEQIKFLRATNAKNYADYIFAGDQKTKVAALLVHLEQ